MMAVKSTHPSKSSQMSFIKFTFSERKPCSHLSKDDAIIKGSLIYFNSCEAEFNLLSK